MALMCKRKKRSPDELKPCVCGCGDMSGNFFAPGHDPKLAGLLQREKDGTPRKTDAGDLEKVLWCSVPLCFFGGGFAKQIKQRHQRAKCANQLGFVPKGNVPCPCD